ncbi:MAG: hypothetical protein BroJett040_08370 [Oligoflexia bacterium]|nr:MAG: hypothetical protein BroJett040_08370 [Oligoflexia bacterium]
MDPGTPASRDGKVSCNQGAICKLFQNPDANRSKVLDNAIKFDIKNSLLNCMSKPMPNWATQHGEPESAISYSRPVCSYLGVTPGYGTDVAQPKKLLYMPLYDRRANDLSSSDLGKKPGCLQQITNTCVQDMHECQDMNHIWGNVSDGPGYKHPVTHIFTAQEVADLGGVGAPLPSVYYSYQKMTDPEPTVENSKTPPSGMFIMHGQATVPETGWSDPELKNMEKDKCKDSTGFQRTCTTTVLPNPAFCECSIKEWVTKEVTLYNYTKYKNSRRALSNQPNPLDMVPGSHITTIDNTYDPYLGRLKSYRFQSSDPSTANSPYNSFIVVDSASFFDLRDYIAGGKFDSGYNRFDSKGLVQTYDSCPVMGLTGGYGGICDPQGKAGCNLPIYGEGPKTTFTEITGKTFSFSPYPVLWSGYVKQWSVLTPEQYLENVKDRKGISGKRLYASAIEINKNPVIMITRSDDYCIPMERFSGQVKEGAAPDMPCIQYMQYQEVDKEYFFVDLFKPESDADSPTQTYGYTVLRTYNIGKDGLADATKPVPGSGTDIYIGGDGSKTGFVSFKDITNPISKYSDLSKGIVNAPAVYKADYSGPVKYDAQGRMLSGPVFNTSGQQSIGTYIGVDSSGKVDPKKGTKIQLEPGTTVISRLNEPDNAIASTTGVSPVCSTIITYPTASKDLFIPTNSYNEFQKFLDAAASGNVAGVTARACKSQFITYGPGGIPPEGAPALKLPNGTYTWSGTLSCNDLQVRPACGQTKMITAQRYCKLENGTLGDCRLCMGANDPDADVKFTDESVAGEIINNPNEGMNRCYFSAVCFNKDASGCPGANSLGGHVFCLAPETKITMADGKKKAIKKIKAGEYVLSFDAKNAASNNLKKTKVLATAVTKNQEIIKINNLKITPRHKILLSTGRAVMAQDIRVGDQILLENGQPIVVEKVESNLKPITVYNLILEDEADGYIANDIRVLSYPMPKGMDQ